MAGLLSRMFGRNENVARCRRRRWSPQPKTTHPLKRWPHAKNRPIANPWRNPSANFVPARNGGGDLPGGLTNLLGSVDKMVLVLDGRATFTAASEPLLQLLGITGQRADRPARPPMSSSAREA